MLFLKHRCVCSDLIEYISPHFHQWRPFFQELCSSNFYPLPVFICNPLDTQCQPVLQVRFCHFLLQPQLKLGYEMVLFSFCPTTNHVHIFGWTRGEIQTRDESLIYSICCIWHIEPMLPAKPVFRPPLTLTPRTAASPTKV